MLIVPRRQPNRRQVSRAASIPPPINGLNARDALADMDPRDALVLENFFPENNYVALRRGHIEHTDTGTAAPVQSLMTYAASSGSEKMLAASSGFIIDVTSSAVTVASGFTVNRWQYTNFTTPGGQFLILVNGTDEEMSYDGSSFTTSGFTASGLTTSNLVNVCSHKERLWFIEKNTLDAWYGDTQAIAGTLNPFPLGSFFDLGGALLACGTLSTTAGVTSDDFLAFVSNQGEVLLYQGTDPASADTWGLVGRFRIGVPIGYRCLVRIGGDLVVITTEGAISLRRAMQYARGQQDRAAVTDKIQDAFNSAARNYVTNAGWEAIVYPKGHCVLFNVPTGEDMAQFQFVMNSNTGAWSVYTGMNAGCWSLLNDELYFGGNDGIIYKADSGYLDNTAAIVANLKTAFNYFGDRSSNKLFTMLRPVFSSSGTPGVTISLSTDFGDTPPTAAITPAPTGSGGVWGSILWGSWIWGGSTVLTKNWQTVGALGFCGAVGMQVTSTGQSCQIQSFDVVGQRGGIL